MALQFVEKNDGRLLEVHVSGKLRATDYKTFGPVFDRLIEQHGKLRVLFEMSDFHGWESGALWEDIKLDFRHAAHIERLALIGEKKWQELMTKACRPFTTAEIRYFDKTDSGQAHSWIERG